MDSAPSCAWPRPQAQPILNREEVHVWSVAAGNEALLFPDCREVLSPLERSRAERFCFERDSQRYLVTRICLRQLLAGYLGLDPRALAFEESTFGKPHLSYPAAATGIEFNLSHSGAFVLFAFSLGRRVGIDVESIRRVARRDSIARRFFSEDERASLSTTPEDSKDHAFFHIWTRKEAFIKAVGRGISLPLASFDVHTNPSTVNWDNEEFLVQDLMVDEGCAAALAVEGHAWKVCRWVF